jgi:hypothetical protein
LKTVILAVEGDSKKGTHSYELDLAEDVLSSAVVSTEICQKVDTVLEALSWALSQALI